MNKQIATIVTLLAVLMFGANLVHAADAMKAPTACEKKADKKKITDTKKRAAYVKKCEKKHSKKKAAAPKKAEDTMKK